MKLLKSIFITAALLALAIFASAQQGAKPQTPATQPLPKGKIAVISTDMLQAEIKEFRAKLESINRQFEPEVKEMESEANKIRALETTIETQKDILGAAKIAELAEQLERMKRNYQRRAEDLQAKGGRQRDVAMEPLNKKLSKFAEEYAARKGIIILFDIQNSFESNTLIWYDPRIDVTKDFINEYNKAYPVATPQPKPQN
ncbi:MAG: OmpH family outer membrane protein [Acidobacteriota bacterium]